MLKIIRNLTIKQRVIIFVAITLSALGAILLLVNLGYIRLSEPNMTYPIRGVDVSSYQGDVDWEVLEQQGIKFAFIKATEGSTHVDKYFMQNWQAASKTDMAIGAYHFLSFESFGETQADNFTRNVPIVENMLPPVIDLELYGKYYYFPPSVEHVRLILDQMISNIEYAYGVKPIIYVNERMKDKYLGDDYDEYTLWVADILGYIKEDMNWRFWQYSHTGELPGYDGVEKYIDLNVFKGTIEQLFRLTDWTKQPRIAFRPVFLEQQE